MCNDIHQNLGHLFHQQSYSINHRLSLRDTARRLCHPHGHNGHERRAQARDRIQSQTRFKPRIHVIRSHSVCARRLPPPQRRCKRLQDRFRHRSVLSLSPFGRRAESAPSVTANNCFFRHFKRKDRSFRSPVKQAAGFLRAARSIFAETSRLVV